jgi:hypothetical protein
MTDNTNPPDQQDPEARKMIDSFVHALTPEPEPTPPPQSLRQKFGIAAVNLAGMAAGVGLSYAAGSTGDPVIGGAGIGAGVMLGALSEMFLLYNHLLPQMHTAAKSLPHVHVGKFFHNDLPLRERAKIWAGCAAVAGIFGLAAGGVMHTRNINLAAIDAACAAKGQPSEPFAMKLPGGKWTVQSCNR